jgi:tetratricopeptide (TPR) repeat protein
MAPLFVAVLLTTPVAAQVDDFCTEFGATPSLNSPFANIPFVYGRIVMDRAHGRPAPRITVTLVDREQTGKRLSVGPSGKYCFRRSSNSAATLIVEVDGVEVARRPLTAFGATQQREDIEIFASTQSPAPGAVSAKFYYPPNPKTQELYRKAAEAESRKDAKQAIGQVTQIVSSDPADFVAWAKLASLHLEQNSFTEAENAVRRSLALRADYTPAWIIAGKVRTAQKQHAAAVEVFKHVTSIEPENARAFYLLGEAYLMAKQGTLGAEALQTALKLDPNGMADAHLLLGRLYELAGAKPLAAKEYRELLAKIPEHPDRKKIEKFIKENPDK